MLDSRKYCFKCCWIFLVFQYVYLVSMVFLIYGAFPLTYDPSYSRKEKRGLRLLLRVLLPFRVEDFERHFAFFLTFSFVVFLSSDNRLPFTYFLIRALHTLAIVQVPDDLSSKNVASAN